MSPRFKVHHLGIASIPDEVFGDCFGFTEVKRAIMDTLHLSQLECDKQWSSCGIQES